MPEAPDLEVFSKNLQKKLKGKKLDAVKVFEKNKINVSERIFKSNLKGKILKTVEREGKELHFYFDDETVLGFHLMLNGEFHITGNSKLIKNKIIELQFEGQNNLVLSDRNKYANAKLNPEVTKVPDSLSNDFNLKYLREGLKKYKSKIIKELLIDQKFVKGIGNAYVDEILWSAGIHPASKAGKIPGEKIKKLLKETKSVLRKAVKEITKREPEIISGELRDFLKVHNRKLKTTETGRKIIIKKIGSKKTYYTNEQKLYE